LIRRRLDFASIVEQPVDDDAGVLCVFSGLHAGRRNPAQQ